MSLYQTSAIILKREDIFEADRLYHLYTEDFGKVRAIAGSVRKINAKLTSHLEPFNLVWVELIAKKNGDLSITTALSHGCLLVKEAPPVKIALFAKMADFSLKMLREPQKDKVLWNFILRNFVKAREVEAGETDNFLNEFKSGFAKIMGFGENLEEARYYLSDFDVV
jgi:recombinational DNA repair protein (RecF pathway)